MTWESVDRLNSSQTKVTKIFGIGLSRTGTTSLYYQMKAFGFTAVHYPASMEEIEEHFFCNDTTVSVRFEELDRLYPNSKFVYTTRALQQWAPSCIKHFRIPERLALIRDMPPELKRWYDHADLNLYGYDQLALVDVTEEEMVRAYHRHDQRVKNYFKERPMDLLMIDITDRYTRPLTQLVAFLESLGLIGIPQSNASQDPYTASWKR